MIFLRTSTFLTILAFAAFLKPATESAPQNVNLQDMDRSVKPGDDFYRFANGGWLKTTAVPAGQPGYGTSAMLIEKTSERVRRLIAECALAKSARGSVEQRVGDYYASFIDEDAIESKGLTPLASEMAAISAISSKTSLSAYLGTTLNTEVDGLTSNSDHVFGVWVNQGFDDSEHYVFHLFQGGLGMPDRDAYIDPAPKMAELRGQYLAHIAAILKQAGFPDSEKKAARILALETRIAQSHARTPPRTMSSRRTTRGRVGTLKSRLLASIGMPTSYRLALRISPRSSSGSHPRLPELPRSWAVKTSRRGRTICDFTSSNITPASCRKLLQQKTSLSTARYCLAPNRHQSGAGLPSLLRTQH